MSHDPVSTPDAVTLVLPLRAKQGMPVDDFYDYWLNAHVTLPARFPGIHSIWLHQIDFDKSLWPTIDGVSDRPNPDDDFHAVPEATFPSFDDLGAFQAASRVQMEDGINFLSQMIGYAAIAGNSETLRDTTDPAPDGSDNLIRHLLFLRRRPNVGVDEFRSWVRNQLVEGLMESPEIIKLRLHLFEELDVTLDHPGVVVTKPLDKQYQAMMEVLVRNEASIEHFAETDVWGRLRREIPEHCEAMHAPRVTRCITTKDRGAITLAGVRGVAVADLIRRVGAQSQTRPDVLREFMPPSGLDRSSATTGIPDELSGVGT